MQGYFPAEALKRFQAAQVELLDVREPDEWDEGHIAGAHWIQLNDLPTRYQELDAGKEWVCVCHVGQRSAMAAAFLDRAGLHAVNMLGGMAAWERAGLPTEAGRGQTKP